ncbi:lipopolysaccharide kinase InaA family protein [Stutzerimonas zhaodongensis]|uniref:lipopolysaccharide kinase InaA family protein n=1 Tax=Stutzerimonas zhaodongensis TaxID=1176257 RepID=UPI0021080086|nr:lipopolysaccharide kinase InaA family protein [Stutzerimonas zhaodongensis]MCQ2028289.1 lipopolysaccharide kinase InaA family protein [Stutzerimonas zhaodongensis]
MKDFIAEDDRNVLLRNGLADFEALWRLDLPAVDDLNEGRGGWSGVSRLEVAGRAYYLKRQSNYLARSLLSPFGEPTFAREFRNISLYERRGIPALQAAFFGQRRESGQVRAILLTRALDGWRDLGGWLCGWGHRPVAARDAILDACGQLVRRLHGGGQRHGCLYPKHVFLRPEGRRFDACLIDLEKTRPLLYGRRDRVRDIEALVRRAPSWSDRDVQRLMSAYLDSSNHDAVFSAWMRQVSARSADKRGRA